MMRKLLKIIIKKYFYSNKTLKIIKYCGKANIYHQLKTVLEAIKKFNPPKFHLNHLIIHQKIII